MARKKKNQQDEKAAEEKDTGAAGEGEKMVGETLGEGVPLGEGEGEKMTGETPVPLEEEEEETGGTAGGGDPLGGTEKDTEKAAEEGTGPAAEPELGACDIDTLAVLVVTGKASVSAEEAHQRCEAAGLVPGEWGVVVARAERRVANARLAREQDAINAQHASAEKALGELLTQHAEQRRAMAEAEAEARSVLAGLAARRSLAEQAAKRLEADAPAHLRAQRRELETKSGSLQRRAAELQRELDQAITEEAHAEARLNAAPPGTPNRKSAQAEYDARHGITGRLASELKGCGEKLGEVRASIAAVEKSMALEWV